MVKYYNEARISDKIPKQAENIIMTGIQTAYENAVNIVNGKESIYESGSLLATSKILKNKLSDRQRYNVEVTVNRDIDAMRDLVRESECSKEISNEVSKTILEFRQLLQYI